MSIFVIGMNHKTAPVSVREKVYFAPEKLSLYLQDVLTQGIAKEAVLLSTCNRSELYCDAEDSYAVEKWFCNQTSLAYEALKVGLYVYQDERAIEHMMRVACGIDSMVLGESQILGQMKTAFSESCAANGIGNIFHRLFREIFSVAKEIRTTTAIGACPVSLASAAVHFARNQCVKFSHANIAIIGAGETTALLLRYLKRDVLTPISIVNRSAEKALALAQEYGGNFYSLDELTSVLAQADIVFSATGSATPIINQALMTKVMHKRMSRSLTCIDIAVPRDIESDVKEIKNVALFCIDDLKAIIQQNQHGREHAAMKADEMIQEKSKTYMRQLLSLDKVTHTIRAYRGQIEEICQIELSKAKQYLRQGEDPATVLDAFAYAFVNKLLHVPSVQLRQAGEQGRFELLNFAKQLFAIPDQEVESLIV